MASISVYGAGIPSGEKVLRVEKWGKKVKQNGKRHHTDKFHDLRERRQLVVRRGEDIEFEIVFNRPLKDYDKVSIVLATTDDEGHPQARSAKVVPLKRDKPSDLELKGWDAYVDKTEEDGRRVSVQLRTPSDCAVGKWMIAVDTKYISGKTYKDLPEPVNKLYMLFNPWNRDDDVYLESEGERQEYVVLDSGFIVKEDENNKHHPLPWNYGQHEKGVLECVMYLLHKNCPFNDEDVNKNPHKVARLFAQIVCNGNRSSGILEGDWKTNKALDWMGSPEILHEYVKKKYSQAGKAQCWVFGGVLTTLCRAIGIPCRPVTNYSSGVDVDHSLTVDVFIGADGKKLKGDGLDSVWNFHVWCEAFMRRPDLRGKYDGWQVIDATYERGPVPVKAIKNGELDLRLENELWMKACYSGVNADYLKWKISDEKLTELLGFPTDRTKRIGTKILTKKVGNDDETENVVGNYKHVEGSTLERDEYLRVLEKHGNDRSKTYLAKVKPLEASHPALISAPIPESFLRRCNVSIRPPAEDISPKAQDVLFRMKVAPGIQGRSPHEDTSGDSERSVEGLIRLDSAKYTGERVAAVTEKKFQLKLKPNSEEDVVMEVPYKEYFQMMEDTGAFDVACMVKVVETNVEYHHNIPFHVRKPTLELAITKSRAEILPLVPVKGTVSLKNPLPVPLRHCIFRLDAPGCSADYPAEIRLEKPIQPGQVGTAEFEITPELSGDRAIIARFNSKELKHATGRIIIKVASESDNAIIQ